jgi:hypothetical protein
MYGMAGQAGHPSESVCPFRTVSTASRVRSRAYRPGQPLSSRRQRAGTALAPYPAPSSAPAMAATVSVSPPPRTAACNPSSTPPVRTIADHAACNAATTHPFLAANRAGTTHSALSISPAQSGPTWSSPIRTSSPGAHRVVDREAPQHARLPPPAGRGG